MTRSSQNSSSRSWSQEERRVRLDALMLWWPYTDGSLRASVEALIDEATAGTWSEENEQMLLRSAAATWPSRVAAKRYAQMEGKLFWEYLVPRCLPTTQVLLLRLTETEGVVSLSRLLSSPQADLALHESERLEIELLVPQIYALLWEAHKQEMGDLIEQAKHQRDEKQALMNGSGGQAALSVFEHEMMYGDE